MKKVISVQLLLLVAILSITSVFAQESITVDTKGVGLKREDALQDALRNAVSQAIGVSLVSESRVENFVLIEDAIQTRTQGYIERYNVTKEVPFPDRYEISIKATVGLAPLRADIQTLSRSVGGIRFLTMYDPRTPKEDEATQYDFAVERVNEYLANKKYRYIEKRRFDQLRQEALAIFRDGGNEESFVQRLGFTSDAQFIILIKRISVQTRSEAFDTRTSSKVLIEAAAYDNCTAEGLGTVVLESDWKGSRDKSAGVMQGIQEAIQENMYKLMYVFNSYVGEWINNGTPFELRFYSVGGFRDFRELRTKLTSKPEFGGQMEIVSVDNYTKLICTFKKRPDMLADAVLDLADQVPNLKEKVLDVKFIYGRQISFAPQNVTVPELQVVRPMGESDTQTTTAKPAPTPTKKNTTTTHKKTTDTKSKSTNKKK